MNTNELPIWYWKRKSGENLGDFLGLLIPELLSQKKARYTDLTSGEKAYVSVGSVINDSLHASTSIWGAGFISATAPIKNLPEITAVRGHLTLDRLKKHFSIDFSNCGIGDPALLLPLILDNIPSVEPTIDIGIIPHYSDKKTLSERFTPSAGLTHKVIDIETRDVYKFINDIRACRYIVSSSLHGLIVAHAFKRPAVWIKLSDNVVGNGFKFFDYFSSVEINKYNPKDFTKDKIHIEHLAMCILDESKNSEINFFDPVQLINTCSFISDKVFRKICKQHKYYYYK